MAKGGKKPRRHMHPALMAAKNPVWAAFKARPNTDEEVARMMTEARMALHRVTIGEMRETDPDDLAFPTNIAMILCEGIGKSAEEKELLNAYLPTAFAAQQALMAALRRAESGQRFGFTGPEIEAMKVLMELWEAQLQQLPQRDLLLAMMEAHHRIRTGNVLQAQTPPAGG